MEIKAFIKFLSFLKHTVIILNTPVCLFILFIFLSKTHNYCTASNFSCEILIHHSIPSPGVWPDQNSKLWNRWRSPTVPWSEHHIVRQEFSIETEQLWQPKSTKELFFKLLGTNYLSGTFKTLCKHTWENLFCFKHQIIVVVFFFSVFCIV